MFHSARIKLTGWYLLIITFICLIFSLAIYRGIIFEIERGLRQQIKRNLIRNQLNKNIPPPNASDFDEELTGEDRLIFEEAKQRVITDLLLINLGILTVTGGLSYFLAGKTLRPIEEMMEDQKRFIADASHELRTPLTSMKTEIEVALRDKQFDLPQSQKLIQSNLEEIEKMQSLTSYLLSLSKYQDNLLQIVKKELSINEILNNVLKKLAQTSEQKQISFTKKVKNIKFQGEKISLNELFTILIDNAIKYSKNNSKIIIHAFSQGKKIVVSIQDFGIGIKAEDLPYIFNRFYRADNSRSKTQVDGYGLGLSIAKNIVEIHQGKISVESKINQGSTFTVELPVA